MTEYAFGVAFAMAAGIMVIISYLLFLLVVYKNYFLMQFNLIQKISTFNNTLFRVVTKGLVIGMVIVAITIIIV